MRSISSTYSTENLCHWHFSLCRLHWIITERLWTTGHHTFLESYDQQLSEFYWRNQKIGPGGADYWFIRSGVTSHILPGKAMEPITFCRRYNLSVKPVNLKHKNILFLVDDKLDMIPVQVNLQGPTASLSSNYSSVFITCETVGATYLIFTTLTHRFGYMGHNPDILRHPLNTHNIGIFSLH